MWCAYFRQDARRKTRQVQKQQCSSRIRQNTDARDRPCQVLSENDVNLKSIRRVLHRLEKNIMALGQDELLCIGRFRLFVGRNRFRPKVYLVVHY